MTTGATIAILNYQRADVLRQAIRQALAQDYPELEVLVVDNASTDGSDRLVETEFPAVRLVRLPENIGCAARNAGVAAAKGEIVLTIDNDVLLTTPHDVRTVVEIFRQRPRVGCVNFMVLDGDGRLSRRDWCHPRDGERFAEDEFPTDMILEGASAIRRGVFEEAGGYWPPLFLGHEGLDLALRVLDAGHELLYTPRVRVRHLASPDARPSSRIYYTFTRNAVWIALRHHRPGRATGAIARSLALMAFASARAGESRAFLRAVRDAVAGLGPVLATRRVLAPGTYRRLRDLRAHAPGWLARVRRHWRERLI